MVSVQRRNVRRSGGGGTGGYRSVQVNRQALFNAQFIVGAGGDNGTSGSGAATDGEDGERSRVITGMMDVFGALGGQGGSANTSGSSATGGAGGGTLYSSFTQPPYGASGQNGGINQGPCNLSAESITPNNGFGGGAPRTCTDGTLNIYQGQAQNGRIRISW